MRSLSMFMKSQVSGPKSCSERPRGWEMEGFEVLRLDGVEGKRKPGAPALGDDTTFDGQLVVAATT